MQPAIRPDYVTEEEFLALPETADKVELIDGEVFMSPAPSPPHQRISGRLFNALYQWANENGAEAFYAPLDVRFGPGRIAQPDLMVFLRPIGTTQGPIDQVPELCIEILSPTNRSYDTLTKRFVYGAAGVTEYWIIDPRGRAEKWTGPNLTEGAAVIDALESGLLPGFRLALAELFV
jgi:Uma2 family endonuclease